MDLGLPGRVWARALWSTRKLPLGREAGVQVTSSSWHLSSVWVQGSRQGPTLSTSPTDCGLLFSG